MKFLITLFTIIMTINLAAQDGKATTTKERKSQETSVSIDIAAAPSIIWSLLTNGSDITRWNSTLTYFEGKIAVGEKVRLKSILDEKRVFKIKIKEMVENKHMLWGDKQGNRRFTLTDKGDGITNFTMAEKIGSFMYPMYKKYLPSFDEVFEQYASDLKKEAELIQNTKN
jgi:uncharacterized protein YndB with AHSA1/START domain